LHLYTIILSGIGVNFKIDTLYLSLVSISISNTYEVQSSAQNAFRHRGRAGHLESSSR
jgi:hypothetical protein